MIVGYVRCPTNVDSINSPNLHKFINEYDINLKLLCYKSEVRIPLTKLNQVYQKDNTFFHRLVMEFALRGFEVITNTPTDVFYKNIEQFDDYFTIFKAVKPNFNTFKDLVLPNEIRYFLEKSGVESSDYFNGIIVSNLFRVFFSADTRIFNQLQGIGIVPLNDDVLEMTVEEVLEANHNKPEEPKRDYKSYKQNTEIGKSVFDEKEELSFNNLLDAVKNNEQAAEVVFPEIIIHSKRIRQAFQSCGLDVIHLHNGEVLRTDLEFLGMDDDINFVMKNVAEYLRQRVDIPGNEISINQKKLMIDSLNLNDGFVRRISKLPPLYQIEFWQELTFEYRFSIKERLKAIRDTKIEANGTDEKKLSLFKRVFRNFTGNNYSPKVEVSSAKLTSELIENFRVEEMTIVQGIKTRPIILFNEVDKELLQVLLQKNSHLIVSGSPFILLDQTNSDLMLKVHEWVRVFRNSNEIKFDYLVQDFLPLIGTRTTDKFKKRFEKQLNDFYGFKRDEDELLIKVKYAN